MKGKINQVDNLVYEAVLTISPEELEEESRQQLKEIRKNVTVPGFRKGKAPLEILKARYGKDVENDTRIEVTNRKFSELMKGEDYRVIGSGMIKSFKPQDDGMLEAVVEFQVEPKIELKKIDKLNIVKEKHTFDDSDVDRALENLRDRHAVIEPVTGGAQDGHYIMADFQEQDSAGTPIIGKKFEDRYFRLGSGVFGERFEEQLLGVSDGDVRNVEVVYADGESRKEKKHEFYRVNVKKVEQKVLPELDDEFARSLGEYEDLGQLKGAVRQEMTDELSHRSQDQVHQNLIDEIIKNNPFNVPPLMVDYYMHAWYEDVKKDLSQEVDADEIKKQNRPLAVRSIKWHMVRSKLIEIENLKVTEADVQEHIEDLATKSKIASAEVEKYYRKPERREKLEDQILDKKIFTRLLQTAKIKEIDVSKQKKSNLIQP